MLWELSAIEASEQIRGGLITSDELTTACLDRIGETDEAIAAWSELDRDMALQQATAMDDLRRRGRAVGPLHGVPVGVSDVFNIPMMAHTNGEGDEHEHGDNVAVVEKLHEAGAVIFGTTANVELQSVDRGGARNPHNLAHTAGRAAAGSAAAVAAGQVPLAVAPQSGSAFVQSASFCGVYGFIPTRGIISRRGWRCWSQTLDQVGVVGRSLADVALMCDALAGFDREDETSFLRPKPQMLAGCRADAPVEPSFAWFDLPIYEHLSSAMREGLGELMEALGDRVERLPAPVSFAEAIKCHDLVHTYELGQTLEKNPNLISGDSNEDLAATRERGAAIGEDEYRRAMAMLVGAENYFDAFFKDFDAIIAPSALGEAPEYDSKAGDPGCSKAWGFAGLPCLSMPVLRGETGLPGGVQLIGSAEEDDRLFRTAAWIERSIAVQGD